MRKDIEKIIEILPGVNVSIDKNIVKVSCSGKELTKKFDLGKVKLTLQDQKLKVSAPKATKRELKMIGTITAHIKNMIKGVQEDFVYTLEVCNIHFPMNVKVDGEIVTIKSFLGEKRDRKAKIMPGSKVEIKGNQITVSSSNIESAGQTATNLEKATRVIGRDRRIFQDGIFITTKPKGKI